MDNTFSKWREFQKARSWARSLELSSETDWRRYRKNNKLPKDIPSNPDREYKKLSVWINWGDFLGTGNLKSKDLKRRTYIEAQQWVISQGIKSQEQWRSAIKSPNFPSDIYKSPDVGYEEFKSWPDLWPLNSPTKLFPSKYRSPIASRILCFTNSSS